MSHPEIESGLLSEEYFKRRAALEPVTTSIDLIDIPQSADSKRIWRQELDHYELVEVCETETPPVALRVFFLNVDRDFKRTDFYNLRVHPSSLDYLQDHYGISTIFTESVVNISKWAKIGKACFHTRDENGNVTKLEAIYRIGSIGGATHVWLSYDLRTKSTIYIISNCPSAAKKRIIDCTQIRSDEIRRPFIVDGFIADACTSNLKSDLEKAREPLIAYECYESSRATADVLTKSFENLHRLSRAFHILHEDFVDFQDNIDFLLHLNTMHSELLGMAMNNQTYESLHYLKSQTATWMRWAANYNSRTKVRIDLFFNLANQNDNRTNLEIANTSKSIAASTLRDSSAMTTIAAITMFFLPGTFVSTVFSMVFFNSSPNGANLELMPCWWYYPAIALPLTVAVFVVWAVWQRVRSANSQAIFSNGIQSQGPWRRIKAWLRDNVSRQPIESILPVAVPSSLAGDERLQYHGRHK